MSLDQLQPPYSLIRGIRVKKPPSDINNPIMEALDAAGNPLFDMEGKAAHNFGKSYNCVVRWCRADFCTGCSWLRGQECLWFRQQS